MEVEKEVIIGIDLAALEKNPTGWAYWKNKKILTRCPYTDKEIVNLTVNYKPRIVAIDAPLTLPQTGTTRKADKEMLKQGYPVFPPLMHSMKSLTKRAISLTHVLRTNRLCVIEIHPASTRKALGMPTKNWQKVQTFLKQIGLKGDLEIRTLTPHEIDAITAALTAYLHLRGKTREVGDRKEGSIVIPIRNSWKAIT
ncbi:MAG: DUF429 domain-containing protein [Candidatus Bathyarchaeia archaeon]